MCTAPLTANDVEFVAVDIRDFAAVDAACKGVDVVFHAAAVVDRCTCGRELIEAVNVGGTNNLLRSASMHGVSRFVYVSSASVVFSGADIVSGDETLPYATRPRSHYAATKATAEQHVISANDRDVLLTCALRPDGIYGPGDRRLIPALLGAYRLGINPFYVGETDKLADDVYLDSLVDALLAVDQRLERDYLWQARPTSSRMELRARSSNSPCGHVRPLACASRGSDCPTRCRSRRQPSANRSPTRCAAGSHPEPRRPRDSPWSTCATTIGSASTELAATSDTNRE